MKKTLITALVITITMVFCACGDNGGENGQTGEVELLASGHSYHDGFLNVGAVVKNKDSSTAYEFYSMTVTAYAKDGSVLGTEEQTMGTIQPGEKQGVFTMIDTSGKRPSKVEVEVDTGEQTAADDDAVRSGDLKCVNVHDSKGEFGETKVTGQIKNRSGKDIDSVYTVVFFKKGKKIVGAEMAFVNKLKAHSKKAFEVESYATKKYNRVEVIAEDWSF